MKSALRAGFAALAPVENMLWFYTYQGRDFQQQRAASWEPGSCSRLSTAPHRIPPPAWHQVSDANQSTIFLNHTSWGSDSCFYLQTPPTITARMWTCEALAPLVPWFPFLIECSCTNSFSYFFLGCFLTFSNFTRRYLANIGPFWHAIPTPVVCAAKLQGNRDLGHSQKVTRLQRSLPFQLSVFQTLHPKYHLPLEGTQTKLPFTVMHFINVEGYTRPSKKLLWHLVNVYCIPD